MFADSIFAVPVSSFRHPVAPPGADPQSPPCIQVAFNVAWLPYIVGSLQQLLLQSTWKVSDTDALALAQQQAFTLISMFANSQPGQCANPPVIPISSVEDTMQFRQNGCLLQAQCADGSWDTIYDPSVCIAQGAAQPTPSGPQIPGQCDNYHVVMSAAGKYSIPVQVGANTRITASNFVGAGSDGGGQWYCPDGTPMTLGICVGAKIHNGGDPDPALFHMQIIGELDGAFYDPFGPINIPGAAAAGQFTFQTNQAANAGAWGSYSFDLEVCNTNQPTGTHTFDFTTGMHGWYIDPASSVDDTYTAGVGFQVANPACMPGTGGLQINSPNIGVFGFAGAVAHYVSDAASADRKFNVQLANATVVSTPLTNAAGADVITTIPPAGNCDQMQMQVNVESCPHTATITKIVVTYIGTVDPFLIY